MKFVKADTKDTDTLLKDEIDNSKGEEYGEGLKQNYSGPSHWLSISENYDQKLNENGKINPHNDNRIKES